MRRRGRTFLWSRGEELLSGRFPDVERWAELRERAPLGFATSDMFPDGTAIDDPDALKVACFDAFIIGTREQVAAKLAAYRKLGVEEIVCWFMDWPLGDSLRSLAEEIRPMLDGM